MKRSAKLIIGIILLVTLAATSLATLGGCTILLLSAIKSYDVVVDGVHLNVNTEKGEATVYCFDADKTLDEGELQVCVIPETVTFRRKVYPVTAISDYTGSDVVSNIIKGDAQIGELVVPKTVDWIDLYDYADIDTLQKITVDEQNPNYYSTYGVLFGTYDFGDQLKYYPRGKRAYSFTFPQGVTSFDYRSCLWDNEYVQDFQIEPGSKHFVAVGGALYSTDYEELLLYPTYKQDPTFVAPKGMKRIGKDSHFWENRYINSVEVAEDSLYLKVEDNALYNKDGSELVFRPDDGRVCFAIPSTVKVVSYNALNGVDYLFVPSSVVVFLDVFEDNGYYLTGIQHIYFESELMPRYLLDVQFAQTQLRFGVSRETFEAFADLM